MTLDENLHIYRQRADFIVLPEYYNVDPLRRDTARNAARTDDFMRYNRVLSDRFEGTLIAGTTIDPDNGSFYNTCHLFHYGRLIGRYRKKHPTVNELKNNISPGQDFFVTAIDGIRISVLICADVLQENNFRLLRDEKPDIIFVPTTSPYRPGETVTDKFKRDRDIFVRGSRLSGAYIVKCCAVGQLWNGRLQGRSLVAAPWGILSRINPVEEDRERIMSIVLDVQELREFRRKQETIEMAN